VSDQDHNPRSYPDRPYVGVGVVVLRGDEVLLAQRGKWPRKFTWSIPGGAQEIGETVQDAALREVREETGLEIEIIGLIDVVDSIQRDESERVQFHYTLVDFVAEWRSGEAVAADDVAGLRWVRLDALAEWGLRPVTEDIILRGDALRRARRPFSRPANLR
jgi:ADP-ribose pyrophosphatase YjhB (NUDIX family)